MMRHQSHNPKPSKLRWEKRLDQEKQLDNTVCVFVFDVVACEDSKARKEMRAHEPLLIPVAFVYVPTRIRAVAYAPRAPACAELLNTPTHR